MSKHTPERDPTARSLTRWLISKHTPGPWGNAKPVYPWQGPIVVVDDDVPICYVDDNTHDDATALANARLIAEAPNMLEALRRISESPHDYACPKTRFAAPTAGCTCHVGVAAVAIDAAVRDA